MITGFEFELIEVIIDVDESAIGFFYKHCISSVPWTFSAEPHTVGMTEPEFFVRNLKNLFFGLIRLIVL
jgi:hypothetical protein